MYYFMAVIIVFLWEVIINLKLNQRRQRHKGKAAQPNWLAESEKRVLGVTSTRVLKEMQRAI
jgi:hypothetical protein